MKDLAQLMKDGYKPKDGQKLYLMGHPKPYWFDKQYEDGEVPIFVLRSQKDGDSENFNPEVMHIHPFYPDEEPTKIEIVQEMPALKKGNIYPVEIVLPKFDFSEEEIEVPFTVQEIKGINFTWRKQHDFYFLDFMLDFPQFFKPIY